MEIFSYIALLITFLILVSKLLLSKSFPQNLPPSPPFSLPILGHLHLLKKPLHRSLSDLSARYGPVLLLRFGFRSVLLVSSPSAIEECLTKNDIVFANRPRLLAGKLLGYDYRTLVWAPYGPHWRNLRRVTGLEIFSSNRINMFSDARKKEIRTMVRKLFRGGELEIGLFRKVELKPMLFELVLNVMGMMATGKRYNEEGDGKEDVEEATRFREVVEETFLLSGASNLVDFLPFLRWVDFGGAEKRLKRLQRKRDEFLQGLIDERRRRIKDSSSAATTSYGEEKKTLIDVLLSLQESDPQYYTNEIIKGTIMMMFTAGTDTSTVTIEWAMSLLLNHPEVLKKAQLELDSHVEAANLIHDSDLPNLPYLHCIIKETLRLCPAGPLLVPHESSEACTVGGFDVPRGTMLLVNAWALQRDPNIWVDPMRFCPERFEGMEGEEKEGFKFVPFGLGRRGCPGAALAMRVMCLVLGALIQCFEWERVGEDRVDMSEGSGLTMPKAKPLLALCKPRQTMIHVLSQL